MSVDNLDDLVLLSKDELIELLKEKADAGVKVSFPGKALSRRIARRVRPRVQKTIKKYGVGTNEERAENLLIEGDNLQALITLYKERGRVDLILTDPPYNTGGDWRYNDKWDEDPNDSGIGELVSVDDRARRQVAQDDGRGGQGPRRLLDEGSAGSAQTLPRGHI
jgi:adenine-specific DNA-methyltransferase